MLRKEEEKKISKKKISGLFSFHKSLIFYLIFFHFTLAFDVSEWYLFILAINPTSSFQIPLFDKILEQRHLIICTFISDYLHIPIDVFACAIFWLLYPSWNTVIHLVVSATVGFACLSFLKIEMQCTSKRGANLHVENHETSLASCKHVWRDKIKHLSMLIKALILQILTTRHNPFEIRGTIHGHKSCACE